VEGVVSGARLRTDGNQRVTITVGGGTPIVVEIILGQLLPVPGVGERIAAFGTFVRVDGWMGIEPAWAVDYIDHGLVKRALPPAVPLHVIPVSPPTPLPTPDVSLPVVVPGTP
jgi:hypothetical protein